MAAFCRERLSLKKSYFLKLSNTIRFFNIYVTLPFDTWALLIMTELLIEEIDSVAQRVNSHRYCFFSRSIAAKLKFVMVHVCIIM